MKASNLTLSKLLLINTVHLSPFLTANRYYSFHLMHATSLRSFSSFLHASSPLPRLQITKSAFTQHLRPAISINQAIYSQRNRNPVIISNPQHNITDSTFSDNTNEYGNGAAIYARAITGISLTISNVDFIRNKAKRGAAIYFKSTDGNITIQNAEFKENNGIEKGNALYLDEVDFDISNTRMIQDHGPTEIEARNINQAPQINEVTFFEVEGNLSFEFKEEPKEISFEDCCFVNLVAPNMTFLPEDVTVSLANCCVNYVFFKKENLVEGKLTELGDGETGICEKCKIIPDITPTINPVGDEAEAIIIYVFIAIVIIGSVVSCVIDNHRAMAGSKDEEKKLIIEDNNEEEIAIGAEEDVKEEEKK